MQNSKHIKSNEISQIVLGASSGPKTVTLLSRAWDKRYAVAFVVIDNTCPSAETHQNAVDIWFVLKGQGKFILGGQLVNKQEIKPGEFIGDSIAGGQVEKVSLGSIIDIPSGVPHQIDARDNRLELIIIKIKD